jgi:hypothetical protein
MANIAIVTSTAFGGSSGACFQAGLTSCLGDRPQPGIHNFQSRGNYEVTGLRALLRSAVDNIPRPDLIVAIGLETARAAGLELQKQDDPKFIFLSGDALVEKPIALAGGVNINAPSEDDTRKDLLKKRYPNVQDSSMYLVVNDNSPIWRNDARNWPSDRILRFFENAPNPARNEQTSDADNNFIAEFDKVSQKTPAPTGLVISVDSYFIYHRTAFTIALATKLPVPVCYPFQDFVDVATSNKGNSIALNRPPLNNSRDPNDQTTAYFQLGKQVGKFFAGVTDVGIVTWRGSEWSETSSEISPPPDEASRIEIEIRIKARVDEPALQKVLAALRGMR